MKKCQGNQRGQDSLTQGFRSFLKTTTPDPFDFPTQKFQRGNPTQIAERMAGQPVIDPYHANAVIGKQDTNGHVYRVITSGKLAGLLYSADAAAVSDAVDAVQDDWDAWFTEHGLLVVSLSFGYSDLDRSDPLKTDQTARDALEAKFIGGLIQMVQAGGNAGQVARTILLNGPTGTMKFHVVLRPKTNPMASIRGTGGESLIVFNPENIDRGLVSPRLAETLDQQGAPLGNPLHAFMIVVSHEFGHYFVGLNDPANNKPNGAVLVFENVTRDQDNIKAPLRRNYDGRPATFSVTGDPGLAATPEGKALKAWDEAHERQLTLKFPEKSTPAPEERVAHGTVRTVFSKVKNGDYAAAKNELHTLRTKLGETNAANAMVNGKIYQEMADIMKYPPPPTPYYLDMWEKELLALELRYQKELNKLAE